MTTGAPEPASCPICGSDRFEPQGARPLARCQRCGTLERHRALARAHAGLLADGTGKTALEIGPLNQRVFGDHLRERGWRYVGVDKSRRGNPADPRAVSFIDFEADVSDLEPIGDNSAQLVIVQHVIEEIDEYERALAELARVLAPRGTALLEIPFDPAQERSLRHPPDHFGNLWSFGRDLLDVVREHFAEVDVQEYAEGAAGGRVLACRHADSNPVAVENALPGDRGWWAKHATPGRIEGYASQCSVRPGQRLELHVSTNPPERYRVTVHRLGWYAGAGGRTVAAHPGPASDVQGLARDTPPISPGPRIESAGWPVTDVINVEDSWTTGVYLARLTLTSGEQAGQGAYVPFVVRPPHGTVADVLVQQPVTTALAYNNWGGKSLYESNSTDQLAAVIVSFDRPFPAWSTANLNARWPFVWDYQLIRFLEREGIDVAYTTDVDTHREPWSLIGHRLLMTSGHDEYWTREMRDAFDAAHADGMNLACMGANTCYWQIRLDHGERTMIEYRERSRDPEPDPGQTTERFRDLAAPRPECLLFGIQYQDGLTSPADARDYELTDEGARHRWIVGTGFDRPARLRGLVGYEWDAIQAGLEPPDATTFFHYECPSPSPSHADVVGHRAASGALVFAAGSLQFTWGLDDWAHEGHADERLQQFMRNVLEELTA